MNGAPGSTGDHPALQVPAEVRKEQVQSVCELPARLLTDYVERVPVLCGRAQTRLVRDTRRSARWALAAHEHVLPSIQKELAHDPNQYIRRALAANRSITAEAASLLAEGIDGEKPENAHPFILEKLAGNPGTPLELLRELLSQAGDRGMLRMNLISNTAIPLRELGEVEEMSSHEQFVVAKRPGISREDLERVQIQNIHPSVLIRLDDPIIEAARRHKRQGGITLRELVAETEEELEGLSPAARETALKLAPEWNGTWDDLLRAAAALGR